MTGPPPTPANEFRADDEPFDERGFRRWYGYWAKKLGINPVPDEERDKYMWRHAYQVGAKPDQYGRFPPQYSWAPRPAEYMDKRRNRLTEVDPTLYDRIGGKGFLDTLATLGPLPRHITTDISDPNDAGENFIQRKFHPELERDSVTVTKHPPGRDAREHEDTRYILSHEHAHRIYKTEPAVARGFRQALQRDIGPSYDSTRIAGGPTEAFAQRWARAVDRRLPTHSSWENYGTDFPEPQLASSRFVDSLVGARWENVPRPVGLQQREREGNPAALERQRRVARDEPAMEGGDRPSEIRKRARTVAEQPRPAHRR